jgi:hypothetical protein
MLPRALALLALATSACTTSLASRDVPGDGHSVQYYFPMQRLALTVEYELVSCRPIAIQPRPTIDAITTADTSEPRYVDYAELRSGLKTTSVVVRLYPNGTLASVGAQADDRSGALLGPVLHAGLSLASGALGFAAAGPPASLSAGCLRETEALLAERDRLLAALRSETASGVRREALLDALARTRAGLTQTGRGAFEPLLARGARPTDAYASEAEPVRLSRAQLGAWFAPAQIDAVADQTETCFQLHAPALRGYGPAEPRGLVYREPRLVQIDARLRDCDEGALVGSAEAWISQLGPLRGIPIENAAFQKNALSVTFTSVGTIETISTSGESRAERAASASDEGARALSRELAVRRTAELEAIRAETDLIDAKADRIEAERRLRALETPGEN